jgi:acyl-CoA synthetase (NDP forming)/GNAT superfamily N-acetyltransferase
MTTAPETTPTPRRVPEGAGAVDALTADGSVIRIRPVSADDAGILTDLHERAGDDTLYRRFLATGHHQIAAEIARLVRPAADDHVALVAIEHDRAVGVCSYEVLPGGGTAEFAIFVDDTCHDRGIGTLLLEHLGVWCRRRGIPDLFGEILPTNSPMLRMATAIGTPTRSAFELGLIALHLDTALADNDRVDLRDLAAARHSLGSLFAPRCVAVVGEDDLAAEIAGSILNGGFTGSVYAVRTDEGSDPVPRFATIEAAADAPDLVIITTPAERVPVILTDAATRGARAAIVVSTGFSGPGADERSRRVALVRQARAAGIRVVGPASLGIVNTDPAVRLSATVTSAVAPGGLAIAAQSAAIGMSMLRHAGRAGLGVASFVSLGDKADVSGNDLLSYWYDDPTATIVALYLESLGNPRRFAQIARAVSRRKPVLVVGDVPSSTAQGTLTDTLFTHAGVVRCAGVDDLLDTVRLLGTRQLPTGDRIAIVGNSTGTVTLCVTAARAAGLSVAELPDDVQTTVREQVTAVASAANPVIVAASDTIGLATAIQSIAGSVDAVVVAVGAIPGLDTTAVGAAVGAAADAIETPVAVVLLGWDDPPLTVGVRQVPVYAFPDRALAALGRVVAYAQWRNRPLGHRPALPGIDPASARRTVSTALANGDAAADAATAAQVLNCYGIHLTDGRPAGVECVAEITHDPRFGSMVSCGVGGSAIELFGDRARRLLPITDLDAAAMWRELRAAPLLTGYGGTRPVDTKSFEDLLLRLGRLAEDLPEVAALTLKVIVGVDGTWIPAAAMRLATIGVEPDAGLRALREPA